MKNNLGLYFCIVVIITISLFYDDFGLLDLNDAMDATILFEIRFPRIIAGIIVGIVLSITGYVFQTILNNNLADSFSLGLASGASFGSAMAVVLGLGIVATSLMSIMMSMLTLLIVLLASHKYRRQTQPVWMILFGMFINLLFSSLLYILVITHPSKATSIMNYLFGSINTVGMTELLMLLPITVIGLIIIYMYHKQIEILSLGNDRATALGVHSEVVTYILLVITSIMCAVLISITGIIGFVGMIIPPFVKLVYNRNNISRMNLTMLYGVLLVLTGDLLGREILNPVQIPVSIMMCLIGMPFFIWIIIKQNMRLF